MAHFGSIDTSLCPIVALQSTGSWTTKKENMPKKSAHDEVSSPVITTFFSDTHESSFNKQKKHCYFYRLSIFFGVLFAARQANLYTLSIFRIHGTSKYIYRPTSMVGFVTVFM